MSFINDADEEKLEALRPIFEGTAAVMGFIPNSYYAMANWPELLTHFSGLARTVLGPGEVEPGLKQLVAFVSSNASGCRYCQAHTSHNAVKLGVSTEKMQAAFEFSTSPLFTDAERAALDLALHAGVVPNATEAKHFEAKKAHYSDRQIAEVVAVISLFGYLNRWNDTMATNLEGQAVDFAATNLSGFGWEPSKHQS
jgi:AhpD family alkylhydroperoxidase